MIRRTHPHAPLSQRFGRPVRLLLAALAGASALAAAAPAPEAFALPTAIAAVAKPPDRGRSMVRVQRDVAYRGAGGPTLDAYYRPRARAVRPAVMVVHGGAWRHGSKRRMHSISGILADHGFAVFNTGYTLARPGRPGLRRQPADLRAAVGWIRRHAHRLRVDPRRIGALGSSAGGNLVGLLATDGDGPLGRGARIRAAVTWSAPFDLARPGLSGAIEDLLGCRRALCPDRAAAASPITHVTPDDPPMLIVNSRRELVAAGQARAMAGRLGAAGVPHRLLLLDGTRHGKAYARTAIGPTINFLRRQLATGGRHPG